MKKITLALSALAVSCAAMAAPSGPHTGKMVIVPADPTAQANGICLVIKDGALALSNDITPWDVVSEQDPDTWAYTTTFAQGGSYLNLSETGVTIGAEGLNINYKAMYSIDETNPPYALCVNVPYAEENWVLSDALSVVKAEMGVDYYDEPEIKDVLSNGWYFFDYTEDMTVEAISAELWSVAHPYATVIVPSNAPSRAHGYFVALNDAGELIHTDVYNDNAAWSYVDHFDSNGDTYYTIENIGQPGKFLYTALDGNAAGVTTDTVPVYTYGTDNFFYGSIAFNLTSDADMAKDYTFLNPRNNSNQVGTWTVDPGSCLYTMAYTRGLTSEQAKAAVDARVEILNSMKTIAGYFEASPSGKPQASYYLGQIVDAATPEEAAEATERAISNALYCAVSDMSNNGFAWINKRTGKYMNWLPADSIVYTSDTIAGFNSLWQIEMVAAAEDPGAVPASADGIYTVNGVPAEFRIRNVGANAYLAKTKSDDALENNTHISPVAATPEEALTFTLQAGGGNIAFVIKDTEELCLNISSNEADRSGLVAYTGVSDGGAGIIVADMPYCTSANCNPAPAWTIYGNTEVLDFGYVSYKSVKGVSLFVPSSGVEFTGYGAAYLLYEGNEGRDTICSWSSEQLMSLSAPVDTVLVSSYWDETGLVHDTIPCKVYNLPLHSEITRPGMYLLYADAFMYTVTNDGGTFYGGAGSQTAYIYGEPEPVEPVSMTVTPAEGTVAAVEKIDLIDIKGLGMAPDWNCTESIVFTKNGETIDSLTCTVNDIDNYMGVMNPWDEGFDGVYYSFPVNFTEPGVYVMSIPEGFFSTDSAAPYAAVTMTWTIDEQDGINTVTNVSVSGRVIYDLQGRRVQKPGRGLYIVNGRKTVLR